MTAPPDNPPDPPPRSARKGGEDSRERLLMAGLRLFAQHGFAKTSTRALAEAAQVNIAAISYYFGDKAGLYRAVFERVNGTPAEDIQRFTQPGQTLAQALAGFYQGFLEPLRHGDLARLSMKLHFRETLEPTGLWQVARDTGIAPMHEALVALLCQHLGLAGPDDDVQRLAVCLSGLGVHLHVGRDLTEQLAPNLLDSPEALATWAERLSTFGLAMVAAEAQRRQPAAAPQPPVS